MRINRWVFSSMAGLIVGLALPVAAAAQGTAALQVTAQVVAGPAPAVSQLAVARLAARTASFQPGRQLRSSTDLSQLEAIRRPSAESQAVQSDANLVEIRVEYLAN